MERIEKFVMFLEGGYKKNEFVIIDPSSYVGEFFSKETYRVTFEDIVNFHNNFKTDSWISCFSSFEKIIPELRWDKKLVKDNGSEKFYKEEIAFGDKKKAERIIGTRRGLIDQQLEGPVKGEEDFGLIDYYTRMISLNFKRLESILKPRIEKVNQIGRLPAATLLIPFESYYLIEYKNMSLFYYDFQKRYRESMDGILDVYLKLIDFLSSLGIKVFSMGSAGLELLSPWIFEEAIIPYVSQITDRIRRNKAYSLYHMCGYSRDIIESGIMDRLKPDIYEGCSTPPCGNITDLKKTLSFLSKTVISKGNIPLQTLKDGIPAEIAEYVKNLNLATRERRHIFGQADATILPGTPKKNIEAFIDSVHNLFN
ncbi:MAG: uroporphyrinogen decarboxylase family protein [Candidatus Omnitrophota bacterium]